MSFRQMLTRLIVAGGVPLVLQGTIGGATTAFPAPFDSTSHAAVVQKIGAMPLTFTKNEGQWDEQVLFRANAGGAVMWHTADGVYYQFTRRIARESKTGEELDSMEPYSRHLPHDRFNHSSDSMETLLIKAAFVGANPAPEVAGVEMLEYKCNYFLGNDPAEWRSDVPNFRAVQYRDVYE